MPFSETRILARDASGAPLVTLRSRGYILDALTELDYFGAHFDANGREFASGTHESSSRTLALREARAAGARVVDDCRADDCRAELETDLWRVVMEGAPGAW